MMGHPFFVSVLTASSLVGILSSFATPVRAQQLLPRVAPAAAGLDASELVKITTLLEESVARRRIAGAVVGVARNGQVAYLEAVGVQDLSTRMPMTERSIFRTYSMTKAVTAVAVMVLQEEGRLQLNEPVSRYLPEFAGVTVLREDGSTRAPARPITIEHLLLHTSGLSHRSSPEYQAARVRQRTQTLQQFVENIVRVPLRFDPGERFLYSESSTVLGRLVEVVSGQRFDDFLRARVLDPLGMRDTDFWVAPEHRDRFTTVYRHTEDGGLGPFEMEPEVPYTERPMLLEGAVGLVSTVPDFLRFAQMLARGGELDGVRILRPSTVELLTRNGLSEEIVRTRRDGTGWALASVSVVVDPAAASAAHAGEYRWDGSAGTEFWVDPTTGTVAVTMWQSAPANPDQMRQRITDIVRQAVRP